MFRLIIKNPDGTVYWRESFNNREDLDEWLAEEQTRPYWNPGFTTDIQDLTPPPPSQGDIDAEAQKRQQIATLKARIKTLATQNDLTAAEIKEALMKFLRIQALLNSLD